MSIKIGRNESCPCGSGKKYKNCCLKDNIDPFLKRTEEFTTLYKKLRKEAHFKECIHPNKSECSEKIVSAHSIQSSKILKKISDDGKLYMPCPKPDLSADGMYEYGKKEASVFTGFCGYHDKTVFQPIEDVDFSKTKEQIFLYTYRAFALEYHKKQEAVNLEQNFNTINPHSSFASDSKIDGKTGFDMSVSDFEKEKSIFDNALINSNYDVLTSIVWEFEGFSNFAATGGEAPMMDYDNQVIQNLLNPNVPVGHIYITVFPENDKTYAIISWLKEYDSTFSTIKKKLENISEQEKKNYINNTLPIVAENIAIKPSSWNAIPSYAKEEFFMLFAGISELMQINGQIFDRFQKPSFDLFEF